VTGSKIDALPENFMGRLQPSHPDLGLAAAWFEECRMNHRECTWRGSDTQDTRPTRILKIERVASSEDFNIRLVEQGPTGEPYTTLSHRWGSLQPLCTTTRNYQAHLNQIDFHSLPRSFQDAVLVTVELGINELWIDSLCILQDSIEDWERECPRMACVYANGVCTVAACDAADGSVGFLNPYTDELRCALSPSVLIRCIPTWHGYDIRRDEESLLSSRGWVVQERILSSRSIAFKSERMQWRCNRHYRSDEMRHPYKPFSLYKTSYDEKSLGLTSQLMEYLDEIKRCQINPARTSTQGSELKLRLYDSWRELVMLYSGCELTKRTDKLPAVSGIAQLFSSYFKDRYMAGLWYEDLCRCITWHRQPGWYWNHGKRVDSLSASSSSLPYRAPTWSWASIDGEIMFCRFPFQEKILALSSAEIHPKGLDPFGQLRSGCISVNGLFKMVKLERLNAWNTECSVGRIYIDSERDISRMQRHQNQGVELGVLLVGYGEWDSWKLSPQDSQQERRQLVISAQIPIVWQSIKKGEWTRDWTALAIERLAAQDERTFRRVGLIEGQDFEGNGFFSGCSRRDVNLI
jgi:hypothetical protein